MWCVCVHLCNKQELFTTRSRSSSVLFAVQAFHRNLFVAVSAASHAVSNSTLVKPQVKLCGRQHFLVTVKAMPSCRLDHQAPPTTLCCPWCQKQPAAGAAPLVLWPAYAWAQGHAGRADRSPQLDREQQEKPNHAFKSKMWSWVKLQTWAHIKIATVGSYLPCSMGKGKVFSLASRAMLLQSLILLHPGTAGLLVPSGYILFSLHLPTGWVMPATDRAAGTKCAVLAFHL